MHEASLTMRDCDTARIPRQELLGLLNTMEASDHERITARMVAVTGDATDETIQLDNGDLIEEVAAAPSTFVQFPVASGTYVATTVGFRLDMVVVAASCSVALALGSILLALS